MKSQEIVRPISTKGFIPLNHTFTSFEVEQDLLKRLNEKNEYIFGLKIVPLGLLKVWSNILNLSNLKKYDTSNSILTMFQTIPLVHSKIWTELSRYFNEQISLDCTWKLVRMQGVTLRVEMMFDDYPQKWTQKQKLPAFVPHRSTSWKLDVFPFPWSLAKPD